MTEKIKKINKPLKNKIELVSKRSFPEITDERAIDTPDFVRRRVREAIVPPRIE
jgi:hypothetical protein